VHCNGLRWRGNDRRAFAESGAEHACRNVDVIADGGYIATSAIIS
jgi:hypothetical protein